MAALGAVHFRPARWPLRGHQRLVIGTPSRLGKGQAEPTVRVLNDMGLAPTR